MDADIRDKILSRGRAREWATWAPPDVTLQEVRSKFGGPAVSDEELVLRVIAGQDAVEAMLAAGGPKHYTGADQPLIKLLGELANRTDCRQIFIQKKGLTLRLEKHTPRLRLAES